MLKTVVSLQVTAEATKEGASGSRVTAEATKEGASGSMLPTLQFTAHGTKESASESSHAADAKIDQVCEEGCANGTVPLYEESHFRAWSKESCFLNEEEYEDYKRALIGNPVEECDVSDDQWRVRGYDSWAQCSVDMGQMNWA
jgi:hypothetical protein